MHLQISFINALQGMNSPHFRSAYNYLHLLHLLTLSKSSYE